MFKRLTALQNELKAPKSQFNKFGNYNYRSLEDILEALKPLLLKYDLSLTISDEIVQIGERFYVRAKATLHDTESDKIIETTALAREALDVKGMSDPQITGAASSYCRKYCLNAMFLIDDTKDDDTDEMTNEKRNKAKRVEEEKKPLTDKEKEMIKSMVEKAGYTVEEIFPKGIDSIPPEKYTETCQKLAGMKKKGEK